MGVFNGGASFSHVTRPLGYKHTQRQPHTHSMPGGAGLLQSFFSFVTEKGSPVISSMTSAGQKIDPQSNFKWQWPGHAGEPSEQSKSSQHF